MLCVGRNEIDGIPVEVASAFGESTSALPQTARCAFPCRIAARLGERDVTWRIRKVKSVWGCCHWRTRYITYNEALAYAPRELVEYVVVHELTHFAVHGHGPAFYALMDARLPGWKELRKRLNRCDW